MTDLYQEIKNLEIKMLQEQQRQNSELHQLINYLITKVEEIEKRIAELESH